SVAFQWDLLCIEAQWQTIQLPEINLSRYAAKQGIIIKQNDLRRFGRRDYLNFKGSRIAASAWICIIVSQDMVSNACACRIEAIADYAWPFKSPVERKSG